MNLYNEYKTLLSANPADGGGVHLQSLAVWRFLFDLQKQMQIKGNMLENGAWHGSGNAAACGQA